MKVFVTGASGWVGSVVTKILIEQGHEVCGLVRSDNSASRVENLGATPIRGSLEDLEVIKSASNDADAVIHTAFNHDDFNKYLENCEVDRKVISAMLDALSGSGKSLIVATGLVGLGDEESMAETTGVKGFRGATEPMLLKRGEKENVRVASVRLPPSVHGVGDQAFLKYINKFATEAKVSPYVLNGSNRWATVHRDDAANAFVLALTKGPAGQRIHAVAEEVPFKDIAEVLGENLDVPCKSMTPEEAAEHFTFLTPFVSTDYTAPTVITRTRLGWEPKSPGLLEDLRNPAYFA
mmetsp:Transcript_2826/g.6595  ORF Transcript_2826/g.6595 Transcript_2826/m.6595 type:complete len:294 (+) Transcript_2826:238-1119(+)